MPWWCPSEVRHTHGCKKLARPCPERQHPMRPNEVVLQTALSRCAWPARRRMQQCGAEWVEDHLSKHLLDILIWLDLNKRRYEKIREAGFCSQLEDILVQPKSVRFSDARISLMAEILDVGACDSGDLSVDLHWIVKICEGVSKRYGEDSQGTWTRGQSFSVDIRDHGLTKCFWQS